VVGAAISERQSEVVPGVGRSRSSPLPAVDLEPTLRQTESAREETPGQNARPGPGLGSDSQAHGGCRAIGFALGDALDEVAPDRGEEEALEDGVGPPAEGYGLASVVGLGMSQEHVPEVVREHRLVASPGGGAAGRALGSPLRVGEGLVLHATVESGPRQGSGVGVVAVGDEAKWVIVREEMEQGVEDAGDGAGVPATGGLGRSLAALGLLSRGARSGAGVGSGVESVDEPGACSDDGGEADGVVLGADEGLEVIEDERLVAGADVEQGGGVEE